MLPAYYIEPHHYEIAEQNGISKKQVDNRFYEKGWILERAITQPVKERSDNGWNEWEDRAVVQKSCYMQRIRRGWSEKEAALTPSISHSENAHKLNAPKKVFTPRQEHIMERNGIPKATAYMRLKKLKWSMEEAIRVPVGSVRHGERVGLTFGKRLRV